MATEGGATLAISLTVKDAGAALEFYKKAFGVKEEFRLEAPDGSVGHGEFLVGNSKVYISGESPEWNAFAMPEGMLSSNLLCINTPDCDAAYKQAIDAGAKSIVAPKDEFWGMRSAVVADPFGYRWSLGQIIEQLTPDEVAKRAQELFAQG